MATDLNKKLDKILINAGDFSFCRRVLEIIQALDLKGREKVLDCGCGDGFYIMALRYLYPQVEIVGIDNDEKILSKAKKYVKEDKLTRIVRGKIEHLPFRDNSFDKIILSEVLEHLEDDAGGLREVFRVLRPKGVLLITVPNHNYPFWWDALNWTRERLGLGHFNKDNELLAGLWSMHLRLYYPNEVAQLVKNAGFKVLKTKLLTHYCFPFSQIILHLGKRFLMQMHNSGNVSDTMEKFNWHKAKEKKFNLVRLGQRVLQRVDQLNENKEFDLDVSSHGILLVCTKRFEQ